MSVTGVDGVPLCRVFLTSELVADYVKLALVDRLPTHGISVSLRNDLAGDRMRPCPVVSPHSTSQNNTEELEKEHPSLFPAYAVIRSKSKGRAISNGVPDTELPVDVPDSESEVFKKGFSIRDFSVGREFQETGGILSTSESPITRSKLIEDQRLDVELKGLFDDVDESDLLEYPNCFYLESGVLMR